MNRQLKKLLSSIFLLFIMVGYVSSLQAQNIAAYKDRQGRFQYYNDGYIVQLDHQEVPFFKLGGDFIIYLNSRDELVYYRDGYEEIFHMRPVQDDYTITQFLILNETGGVFSVINHKKVETLNLDDNTKFIYGDSIVAFIDYAGNLKSYYKGETHIVDPIEPQQFIASDNSFAFIDNRDWLRFHKNGENFEVADDPPNSFKVGQDLVLFTTEFDEFNAWRNDEIIELDEYPPKSYKVGDKIAAYVSDRGYFYLIDEEGTEPIELMPAIPQFYDVIDNTLIYVDDRNYFNVYYKGKNYALETYRPSKFEYYDGVVAYVDVDGRLKAFYEGKTLEVSENIIESFFLQGRVIVYEYGNKDYKIFHNGKRFN